jgi:hypothetical protein
MAIRKHAIASLTPLEHPAEYAQVREQHLYILEQGRLTRCKTHRASIGGAVAAKWI